MRTITIALLILVSTFISSAQEKIDGGPYGLKFGLELYDCISKVKELNPKAEIKMDQNEPAFAITSGFMAAGENFETAFFTFLNDEGVNRLIYCCFIKHIKYEDSFFKPLDYKGAFRWLETRQIDVLSIIKSMKKVISAKYGEPSKDTSQEVVWRDSDGNSITIKLEVRTNTVPDDLTDWKWGAVPAYVIVLIYSIALSDDV